MNTSNRKIVFVRMLACAGIVALLVPCLVMGKALEETGVGAGARSLAIGECGAAALSGAESLYWNTAGIMGSQGPEFILGHTAWVEGLSTESGAAVVPFGGLGSMGVCASWQTYSGIEERDSLGNLVKTFNLTTGSGSLAWAYPFMKHYSAGISGGFLVQNGVKLNETSIPLGLGVRAEFGNIAVGLSGQDLLSTRPTCNISTSYRMTPGGYGLLLSGGAIIRELEMRIGAGAEIAVGRMVKVRLGYMLPLEETQLGGFNNLTAGFGLVYGVLGVDYAFLPLGDIGQVHRFQLTFRFGEGPKTETAIKAVDERPLEPKSEVAKVEKQESQAGNLNVAVLDLAAQGVSNSDAAIVTDMIRNAMAKQERFNVIEKANMERILAEQAFQQSGCTTEECAVNIGKLLNVNRMVVGSFGKLITRYVVNVRVVNVENGKILLTDEAMGDNVDELMDRTKTMAERMAKRIR